MSGATDFENVIPVDCAATRWLPFHCCHTFAFPAAENELTGAVQSGPLPNSINLYPILFLLRQRKSCSKRNLAEVGLCDRSLCRLSLCFRAALGCKTLACRDHPYRPNGRNCRHSKNVACETSICPKWTNGDRLEGWRSLISG